MVTHLDLHYILSAGNHQRRSRACVDVGIAEQLLTRGGELAR
jgi:hypothetical protein